MPQIILEWDHKVFCNPKFYLLEICLKKKGNKRSFLLTVSKDIWTKWFKRLDWYMITKKIQKLIFTTILIIILI
jgi:hypothetical protein